MIVDHYTVLLIVTFILLSLQRILQLSKPTEKWRPAIEKETGMGMKQVPPPPYPGVDTICNGKTEPPGFQNPAFTEYPNVADDSTQL